MTMLRRWLPAGLLFSSVATMSVTSLADKAPVKSAAPSTAAKPAAPSTSAKPAASASAAKPAAPAPDPKAAAAASAHATTAPAPDAKAAAPDPKAGASTASATDADKETTRLIEEGRKAYKAGQFDKAREQFAAAYKLKAEPNTLLLLALAESKSNRPRDAAEHLEVYLREAKTASAEDKETATRVFNDVTSKLGTWTLKIAVAGADVLLDGRLVGQSPLVAPLFVEPGTHEIVVKKEGFAPSKEMNVVSPNTESETTVVLKPLPTDVGPKKPPTEPEKPKPPPPPPLPAWHTYAVIGGGALTALGLGLGIGLSVSASGKGEEADQQLADIRRTTPTTYGLCGSNQFQPNAPACAKLSDTLSSQDARANGAVAGFVFAGIGAVGTVGLILLPKIPIGRQLIGMKFAPVISLDRLGGTLSGSF